MPKLLKTPLGIMLGLAVLIGFIVLCGHYAGAFAADLGGNCCSDLEERIAELEATTVKKNNRKISVTIYGQISEGVLWYDIPTAGGKFTHTQVQSNSNRDAASYVGVKGEALVSPGWKMGFAYELGVGGFSSGVAVPLSGGLDTNATYTRQDYIYVQSDQFGRLSIGKQTLATYDIGTMAFANWSVVHTPLSLAPLTGPTAGSALDVFDGGITESVKYVSPHFFKTVGPNTEDGIWFEADWASAVNVKGIGFAKNNGDLWDLALKGWKDVGQLRVGAQVGYRDGAVVDLTTLGIPLFTGLNLQGVKVWSGSAGVMHLPTGIFLSGTYSDLNYTSLFPSAFCAGGCPDLKAWELQGGIEEKWTKIGKTTVFATFGQADLSALGWGNSNQMYGLGLVQNVEAAAADFGIYWQRYSPDAAAKAGTGLTGSVDTVMGTARIKF